MRKLTTLIPFGLNDHITSSNINLGCYDFRELHRSNTPFFSFPSERRKRSHGHRKSTKLRITKEYLKDILDNMYGHHESYRLNDLYVLLRSTSRDALNLCLKYIDDICESDNSAKKSRLRQILLAYNSQYIKPPKQDDDPVVYCTIPFVHKAIEKVGIRELLKYKDLKAYLPHKARKYKIRTTFAHGPVIGKKIFNYNKVLNNLGSQELRSDTCDCQTKYAPFVYEPHGHVHTGNLEIIENEDLNSVMSMGAKYRLTPSISRFKILSLVEDSIIRLKKKLCRASKTKVACFDMWFDILHKRLKRRCKSLEKSDLESNDIFEKAHIAEYLKQVHERFVIVPVDKASNNFAIICKTFYINVIMKELGINKKGVITGNNVYKYVSISQRQFFKEQECANTELGNALEEENKHIPLLYWTSKQHKNPYKFRFIAGASHCTNKTISIEVALALKSIKTQFKNHCAVIKKNSGLSYFWSIDNSVEFLDKLQNVKFADSIKTHAFSTLYTNLPLDDIYMSLERLIIKMFKNSGSNGILVNAENGKAFWSQGTSYSSYKFYTIDKLLDALKFILYNTYIQFAGNIFKQIQGIPMGGNASPFIADLYLAWHEYCYMEKLAKSKLDSDRKLARTLSLNSRYLDDIANVNFLGFGKIAKEIYHPSLLLEESSTGYHSDTFLDLNIRVHNGRFIIGIYHKVDDFDFEVINFPFLSSNIHSQVGYNSFYSQLIRYYRLCNNKMDFIARVKILKNKLSSRGYNLNTLGRCFLKFCGSYPAPSKYGEPNGRSLWEIATGSSCTTSCWIYNEEAVKAFTKPCTVTLEDIYHKEKYRYKKTTEAVQCSTGK